MQMIRACAVTSGVVFGIAGNFYSLHFSIYVLFFVLFFFCWFVCFFVCFFFLCFFFFFQIDYGFSCSLTEIILGVKRQESGGRWCAEHAENAICIEFKSNLLL